MPNFFKKLLLPRWQDLTIKSKYNGKVKVKKFFGRYAVWVDGYEQSGPLVEAFWKKALSKLTIKQCNNVLILGLGCGSVAEVLIKKFPGARLTGVEIDPVMIDLGKKYFGLTGITIKIAAAQDFVKETKQKYDLILVDLYIGGNFPEIHSLRSILAKDGLVVFNFCDFGKKASAKKIFEKNLAREWEMCNKLKTEYNTLFFAR